MKTIVLIALFGFFAYSMAVRSHTSHQLKNHLKDYEFGATGVALTKKIEQALNDPNYDQFYNYMKMHQVIYLECITLSHNHHFLESAVKQIFGPFDRNHDHQLNKTEFHQAVQVLTKQMNVTISDQEVDQAFTFLDKDSNNHLNATEGVPLLKLMLESIAKSIENEMFALADNLGLGFAEVSNVLSSQARFMRMGEAIFGDSLDKPQMSREEFTSKVQAAAKAGAIKLSPKDLNDLFNFIDSDADGQINTFEMLTGVRAFLDHMKVQSGRYYFTAEYLLDQTVTGMRILAIEQAHQQRAAAQTQQPANHTSF